MPFIIRHLFILCTLMLACQSVAAMPGAEIDFNSACDFKALTMNIREEDVASDVVTLNVTLQPEARTQLAEITRNHMDETLNMFINGIKINTATIRAELNTGSLRVVVNKAIAEKIFPGLLVAQCSQV